MPCAAVSAVVEGTRSDDAAEEGPVAWVTLLECSYVLGLHALFVWWCCCASGLGMLQPLVRLPFWDSRQPLQLIQNT